MTEDEVKAFQVVQAMSGQPGYGHSMHCPVCSKYGRWTRVVDTSQHVIWIASCGHGYDSRRPSNCAYTTYDKIPL